MRKNVTLLLYLSLIVLISGCALIGIGTRIEKDSTPDANKYTDEAKQSVVSDEEDIKNLVGNFGKKLQTVTLQAPKDILEKGIQENYGEFVSQTLIKKWIENPVNAPGRLTSSPWPERIEIQTVKKLTENQYEVSGEIIEITSIEKVNGGTAAKRPINLTVIKSNNKWVIDNVTLGSYEKADSIIYKNTPYSFNFTLPISWKGYSIINDKWEGLTSVGSSTDKINENGPKISIRHPQWSQEKPRQDIPILIFTLAQWDALQQDKFHIGAAPIGPSELGRNSKYVFALPARYNYAFPAGYEEVADILKGKPLRPENQ